MCWGVAETVMLKIKESDMFGNLFWVSSRLFIVYVVLESRSFFFIITIGNTVLI